MSHEVHAHSETNPAGLATIVLLLFLAGCSGNGDPFAYVPVKGTVTYDDGSKIPASEIALSFIPQSAAIGKAHPRVGMAYVDANTGTFQSATTHKVNDGLVRGKHKVTVTGANHTPLSANIVPVEYGDFAKTPLEVDTDHLPFQIKIPKPTARADAKAKR